MQQVAVRFAGQSLAAHDRGAARSAVWRCFTIAVLGSGALGVLIVSPLWGIITSGFGFPDAMAFRLSVAVWIIAESTRLVLSEAMRGYNDIRGATILGDAGRNLLLLGGVIAFAQNGLSLDIAVAISATTGLLLLSMLITFTWVKIRNDAGQPIPWRSLLAVAGPLTVASLGLLALSQVDVWIVGIVLDAKAAAVYGTANRLVSILAVPIFVVNAVTLPLISRARVTSSNRDLGDMVRGTSAVAAVPMLLGFIAIAIWGVPLLTFLFGDSYAPSYIPLVILAIGQVVNVLTGLCGVTLIMFGHERAVMYASLASALLMITLTLLASTTGSLGLVALACTAALVVQNLALMVLCRLNVGVWTLADPRPSTLRRVSQASMVTLRNG